MPNLIRHFVLTVIISTNARPESIPFLRII
jgi:hypothetical protein